MVEKFIKRKITRTDLEKRMFEGSLQGEYDKYSGKHTIDSLLLKKPKVEAILKKEQDTIEDIDDKDETN
jgi:penicillin-binding protein 2